MTFAATIDAGVENLIDALRKPNENGDFGGTVSLIGEALPATGYMVGGYVDSLIVDSAILEHGDVLYQMIMRWLSGNFALATKFSMFLGGWIDSDTDLLYIDLSQHFENIADAKAVGRFHDEIAIWDLANAQEIRL